MWLTLLGIGKKYWAYLIVGVLFASWLGFTVLLYNSNQTLHEELGAADAAILASRTATSVCIAERDKMDTTLIKLKKDIADIQADNAKYKADLYKAEGKIIILEGIIITTSTEVDNADIPVECNATFNWMLERVFK